MRPILAAVVWTLAIAPPAHAAAGPSFVPFATSVVPLVSDGATAAAYMPSADTVRVLHADGGFTTLAVAPGCVVDRPRGVSGLRAVGGGFLLYFCPGSGSPTGYVVQSIAGGQSQPVPGALPSGDSGAPPLFDEIGSRWLGGTIENHEGEDFPFDLQWRTGAQFAWPTRKISIREVTALDRPRPTRRLCAPLRRSNAPDNLGLTTAGVYRPFVYEPPWGVGVVASGRLVVQRCGLQRRTTIASHAISQLQGAGGVITWVSGTRRLALHAYSLATHRSTTSRPVDTLVLSHQHLGGLLFISTVASRVGGGDLTATSWSITTAQAFPDG